MSLRFQFALLIAFVLPAAAHAQDEFRLKPGAKGKVCLECHLSIQETMEKPHVHSPVSAGECSECHNPHASSHGQLLATEVSEICVSCHADIVPEETLSAHESVVGGNCVTCHDPHASENPNNLVSAGNQLCFGCHEDHAAENGQHEFKHSPVERDCLACHDPHTSATSKFLLKNEMGALCGECHKTNQPSFVERHMGYPVADSRCSSCHDPHGSDRSGILLAEVHEPLMNKMCNQCHLDSSSPDALQTKATGIQLCRGCHSSLVNETLTRNRIHWPVGDETACLNCHNPHASNEKALLLQSTKPLCGSCHQDVIERQDTSVTKHAPVDDGDCSACHDPHAADNLFLTETASLMDLCGTCHEWGTHSAHPIGERTIDQRNMNLSLDCLSCHRSHGSPFKAFAHADPDGDLCTDCHQEVGG
jgi:predicted CXXCH cytochrome family protein